MPFLRRSLIHGGRAPIGMNSQAIEEVGLEETMEETGEAIEIVGRSESGLAEAVSASGVVGDVFSAYEIELADGVPIGESVDEVYTPGLPTANLLFDLDATKLVGFTDGDPVETFTDQSGNGRHFDMPTAAARSTYRAAGLNGRPSLEGDLIDDYYQLLTFGLDPEAPRTLYFVTVCTTDDPSFFVFKAPPNANHSLSDLLYVGQRLLDQNGLGWWARAVSTPSRTIPMVRVYKFATPSTYDHYVNGTRYGPAVVNFPPYSAPSGGLTLYMAGHIGRVLLYGVTHDDAQRAVVESVLYTQFGITP